MVFKNYFLLNGRKYMPQLYEDPVIKENKNISSMINAFSMPEKQRDAVDAIISIGKEAVEPLIMALKDENICIRGNAAYALGKIGDERAIEPLIQLLKDKEWDVRIVSALSLMSIGRPAIEPVICALKCCDGKSKKMCESVLLRLYGRDDIDCRSKQKIFRTLNKILP
jgi:hypothetical protein